MAERKVIEEEIQRLLQQAAATSAETEEEFTKRMFFGALAWAAKIPPWDKPKYAAFKIQRVWRKYLDRKAVKSPKPPSDTKVVRVTYGIEDEFLVPKELDLENKLQVKEWEVRYNILHITKADDTELKIESGGLKDHFRFDLKYPDTTTIIDKNESVCYNSDNESVGCNEDEEEEDEETSDI